jgi:hypothetical protein
MASDTPMRSAAPAPGGVRDIVPVTPERHRGRFWRRFTSWDFARAHRLVPIVLGEHEQVAASLPIVFVRTDAGLWPVALTRLTERGDGGALISPEGRWRGGYVPSSLRVHPFAARRGATGDQQILVDEASGLVTDTPEDEPFFDDSGAPAPALQQVIDFFRDRAVAEHRTRAAMSEAAARAPLVPFTPPESLGRMAAQGLFVPDRARIEGLGRADLGALHRGGALALMQAQAVSMHHLPVLAAAETQIELGSGPHRQHTPAIVENDHRDTALSGFLDALAESRDRDSGTGSPDDRQNR